MAVDKLVDSDKLDACCAAEAAAIIAKGGGTAPLAYDFANNKGFADAIASISSGGVEITDGIVVKARNANGAITEVEKYGNCGFYEFGIASNAYRNFPFGYTEKVTLHDCTELGDGVFYNRFITQIIGLENITRCGQNCFFNSALTSISLPNVTYIGSTCFRSLYATTDVYLPKLTNQGEYIFQGSTILQNVQIGSVGYPAKHNGASPFVQCPQTGLTITAYCAGANADALLANYRNGATNATIIIKASEATTYGGTSYAAGETMITSEVA